jgi:hypothetical protein
VHAAEAARVGVAGLDPFDPPPPGLQLRPQRVIDKRVRTPRRLVPEHLPVSSCHPTSWFSTAYSVGPSGTGPSAQRRANSPETSACSCCSTRTKESARSRTITTLRYQQEPAIGNRDSWSCLWANVERNERAETSTRRPPA